MGLGLLLLVSIGKENLYLSAQAEITFFKIAYKRHTNFSIEPTPQYFKTTPDFGRRCTVNISKNADLLEKSYLYVELPTVPLESHSILPREIKKFAWNNKIGLALINFIELEIGGIIVDRHYSDWINIWHELTMSLGLRSGYNKMIGNIEELYRYENGKSSYILYIPLSFWFCQDSGLALPLLALAHNDVKIHVEFNDFTNCFKTQPTHWINIEENYSIFKEGEKLVQNVNGTIAQGSFVYYDVITKKLYYNAIKGTFLVPTTLMDLDYIITGSTSNYTINIQTNSFIVQDEPYFKYNSPSLINSYLIVNYIYLDNLERFHFINSTHQYLVPVVQSLPQQIVYSTNINYKLDLVNPTKLLVWRCILNANLLSNNLFEYTSLPYTDKEENLIHNQKLIINSIERMNLSAPEHYTYLPKYEYNLTGNQNGIYIYSFGLYPKEYQPTGSLNFSKIDDAYLHLTMNKIINYQNPASIRAYGLQYNLFRVSQGIGGLGFNL